MFFKYPNIDMIQTGERIRLAIGRAGYTVKQIQGYLHLSCPQSIYRWLRGETLPSVSHLYAISHLLGCAMEDLIVPCMEDQPVRNMYMQKKAEARLMSYYQRICDAA